MKNIKFTYILGLSLTILISTQFLSCKKADLVFYDKKPCLYFPTTNPLTNEKGIDSTYISFANNPGKESVEVSFRINLIGHLLEEDTEYRVKVVDKLTNADPSDYSISKLIFKKGVSNDLFTVTIKKSAKLDNMTARVAFMLVANNKFDLGYYNEQIVKIKFDNVFREPEWWDKDITAFYGEFSRAKYEVFIIISGGIFDLNLIPTDEWRQIGIDMKEYIIENNIKEEDGSPVPDIPGY